jgi:hypothetical protein
VDAGRFGWLAPSPAWGTGFYTLFPQFLQVVTVSRMVNDHKIRIRPIPNSGVKNTPVIRTVTPPVVNFLFVLNLVSWQN